MEKRFVWFLDNDNWNLNIFIGCLFKFLDMVYIYICICDNKYNCMLFMEIVIYGIYMYMYSVVYNMIIYI